RLVDHAHVVSAALGPDARGGDVRAGEGGLTPLVGGAGAGEEHVDLAPVVSDTDTGHAPARCAHQRFLPRPIRCTTVAARAAERARKRNSSTSRMSYPTLTRETRSNDVRTSGSFLGGFAVPL